MTKNKKLIVIISIAIVLLCILAAFIIGKSDKHNGNTDADDNVTTSTTITSTATTTTTAEPTNTTTTTTTSTTTTTETSPTQSETTTAATTALDAVTTTTKITTAARSTAKTTTPAPVTTAAKVTTPAVNVDGDVNEIVRLVNAEREKNGIAPVKLNSVLTDAAMLRAQEITRSFSHDRTDGRSWFSVLGDYNLSFSSAAENIAAGNSTPESTMQQWINSQVHYRNIMDPNVSEIGVGFVYDPNSPYGYYWVQLFRNP